MPQCWPRALRNRPRQDSELEADRMGVVLATRSGYDPFALAAALQSINGNKGSDVKFMFSTHPRLTSD